jgi:hypothetical protein
MLIAVNFESLLGETMGKQRLKVDGLIICNLFHLQECSIAGSLYLTLQGNSRVAVNSAGVNSVIAETTNDHYTRPTIRC